jgi:hypothetical protein
MNIFQRRTASEHYSQNGCRKHYIQFEKNGVPVHSRSNIFVSDTAYGFDKFGVSGVITYLVPDAAYYHIYASVAALPPDGIDAVGDILSADDLILFFQQQRKYLIFGESLLQRFSVMVDLHGLLIHTEWRLLFRKNYPAVALYQ